MPGTNSPDNAATSPISIVRTPAPHPAAGTAALRMESIIATWGSCLSSSVSDLIKSSVCSFMMLKPVNPARVPWAIAIALALILGTISTNLFRVRKASCAITLAICRSASSSMAFAWLYCLRDSIAAFISSRSD